MASNYVQLRSNVQGCQLSLAVYCIYCSYELYGKSYILLEKLQKRKYSCFPPFAIFILLGVFHTELPPERKKAVVKTSGGS